MPYNCLYQNKGNNSSVKESILTKLAGYRESMVLIICAKNKSNLTNRYCVDRRTDDAKTISLRLRRGITITYTSQLSVMENIRSNGYAFDMENLEWISKAPITVILTDEFTYGGNRTKFAVLIKACKGGSSYFLSLINLQITGAGYRTTHDVLVKVQNFQNLNFRRLAGCLQKLSISWLNTFR